MSITTVWVMLQYFSLITQGGYKELTGYIRSSCLRPNLSTHNLENGNKAHKRMNEICIQNIRQTASSTNAKDAEILVKTVKWLTYISILWTVFLRTLVFCELSIGDLWKNQETPHPTKKKTTDSFIKFEFSIFDHNLRYCSYKNFYSNLSFVY